MLALLFALAYAGARNVRAYLMKPLLDEVLPHARSVELSGWNPFDSSEVAPAAPTGPTELTEPTAPTGRPDGSSARTGAVPEAEPARRDDPGALANAVRESLWKILLAGLAVLVIVPIAHFGKDYLAEYMLGRVRVDIQQQLCAKLLTLPLGFHHRTTRGDTLSRTLNDVERAHRSLQMLFGDVLQDSIAMLVGVGVLLSISWQLSLVSLAAAPLIFGVVAIFGRRIRHGARRRQEKIGDLTQRLVEILAGIKVIKAFRAERHEEVAFERENRKLFRRSMKVVKNRVLSRSLIEMLNNGVAIGLLLLGAVLVLRGQWGLTTGGLAAFLAVLATTYRPTKSLSRGWTDLMDAIPAAERFFELLDERPELPDAPDAVRIDGVRHGIRFSKVSFSYGREPVLRDVSLEARAGEIVAIVGRTGAGKTTLLDLLLRFYDPTSGSIEIDGVDLRRVSRDSLLDHVAVVTQEPFLFAGTIAENLRYARPDASQEELERAAHAAHIDEFVTLLPDGWDTQVGESGVALSGGQRQRLTIARALLKNPSILIFDEATSSLDAKSERAVQEAIDRLLSGRTVFVIAHRLSTVRRADKIVILEDGRVSRVGTHDALMAEEGLYRELVSLQTDPA